jgi:hypothetical protein
MASRTALLQGITQLLAAHPKGCVFRPGAAERITDRLLPYFDALSTSSTEEFRRVLRQVFELEEIYCPHEPGRRRTWC